TPLPSPGHIAVDERRRRDLRERMKDFGQQLRAERERQSLLLGQVAGTVRVREQYLDAIERHDWDALPEPVFTRGYIQSYARFLHMDENLFLKAYARVLRIAQAAQPSTPDTADEAATAFLERAHVTRVTVRHGV